MLPLLTTVSLTLTVPFLAAFEPAEERCYDHLTLCAKKTNTTVSLDVGNISANTVVRFCEHHAYSIIPCLASSMGEKTGNTFYNESLILQDCFNKDSINYPDMKEMLQFKKILRLFSYACVYNSAADLMDDSECFNKMFKQCVDKNPPNRRCFYWQCKNSNNWVWKKGDEDNEGEGTDGTEDAEGEGTDGTEDAEDTTAETTGGDQTTTPEEVIPTAGDVIMQAPLRRGNVDMRNTDREDRILDPTRRRFALSIKPNYRLQCFVIILFILISTSF